MKWHRHPMHAAMAQGLYQDGGKRVGLGEVEVLAGSSPPREAGAALEALALRKVCEHLPLRPLIVCLQ